MKKIFAFLSGMGQQNLTRQCRGSSGNVFFRTVLIVCAVMLLLPGILSGGEKNERKVVRVAYMEFNRLLMVDANNTPVSGYDYEYIQSIATYAGWKVQYVPCDSFAECVRKLLSGEVELAYDISYTEERAKKFLFPNEPMGYEYYYLYTSAENTSITLGDYSSMNGRTVGITSGTILPELLKQWCRKRDVQLKFVEYEDISKKEEDLYAGKIDLDLEISMLAKPKFSAIEKVGSSAYYLVGRHGRQDLIDDINAAVEKILSNDLFYFSRLQERYFSDTTLSRNLTVEEKKWIADHKVLRVGYFNDYLPFSAKDENGKPIGAGIEAIREIIRALKLDDKLKVEFICFNDQKEGYKAVETGKVDLMIPAYISNSVKQDYRLIGGKVFATLACDLAYSDGYWENRDKRIGVNRNNLMQYYYCRNFYPDSKIVFYNDIRGCFDGLLDGTLDGTFLNGIRSDALLKSNKYRSIKTLRARYDFEFKMAFAENNIGLLLLMDRGLTMLGNDFVNKAAYSYLGRFYTFSVMDYLQAHILLAISAVAVIVALIAALIVYWFSNRKLKQHSGTIEKQRQRESELRAELETKQTELEAALQTAQAASNEKTAVLTDLEDASELARLASFHYNLDTCIRTGSNMLCELWPVDENGQALLEEQWVCPEDISLFKQNMRALFEKKNQANATVQFSFRAGLPSHELRYYRMKLTVDKRFPRAVTGIVQDVTELAQSMLKMEAAQALWNAAINVIPIMFSIKDIDDDYRYLLCNREFAKAFNFSPDEIVGKTDHEIFHDGNILSFADRVNSTTTGTDGLMEIEGEIPDGRGNLRYVRSILRGFKDARGHRLLLAASSDETDLNRLLQNRRVINQLLADIIAENDLDLCIRRTLETVCKILGASRGCLIRHEVDGTKAHCVFEYVEPTHAHASFRMLDRTLSRVRGVLEGTEDKRTFICSDIKSFDWKNTNGDWHQAAIALDLRAIFLSNIVSDGKVAGTVGFNFEGIDHTFSDTDISLLRATTRIIEVVLARKHAQTLIMDALAQAQAADKAKSFFIASVSHEIRTPLNSVIGFAEILREGGVSKEQEKEYLSAISTSANALLMLINDVLDLSKLEANQMKIVTEFTDFNALCREVMLIFTFRAQENGNKLVSDVPEDLPELEIDNIRIRQILINLFGNAVKFTKNGSITLHVSFTPDPGSADTGTLRCAVSDTGIGISEEDQKKLMEPFVQLSGLRGTNAVNNGTGLGLSISKRLAVCMNGELTCTSRIGEGSTFAVTLNSVRCRAKTAPSVKEAKSEPEESLPAQNMKQIRILIVDDVLLNLRVARALFNKIGFENVFTVQSGRAALELLGHQPIDLILSDIWMPEMNGSEFSAEVKKDPRFAHIPLVAQTADVETNGNFDMSHFDAVILKPLTRQKLSKMIKRILEDGDLQRGDDGAPVILG